MSTCSSFPSTRNRTVTVTTGLLLLLHFTSCASVAFCGGNQVKWRGVWEWSMKKQTEADLIDIADTCKRLGFNVLMMFPPKDKIAFMTEQCHQRGIKLYLSTVFSGGEKSWQQVMSPAERKRARKPFAKTYQQGGEPFTSDELLASDLPCWNRPEVVEYFRKRVTGSAQLPVDGLAFDMVGYMNYYRCYCPVCETKLTASRKRHPEQSETQASAICAEQAMVDFINEMAKTARTARHDLGLTIHVYPYFRPDPYYGNRLEVDTVGETVSWFFPPRWPLGKVRRLTKEVVRTQKAHWAHHLAAPFIGYYSDPPECRRSAQRLKSEIEIVRASGARALQFAELGHIVRDPEVARVVADTLVGYDKPARDTSAETGTVNLIGLTQDMFVYVDGKRVRVTDAHLLLKSGWHTLQIERMRGEGVEAVRRLVNVHTNSQTMLIAKLFPVLPPNVYPGPPGSMGPPGVCSPVGEDPPRSFNAAWAAAAINEWLTDWTRDTKDGLHRFLQETGVQPAAYRLAIRASSSRVAITWGTCGLSGPEGPIGTRDTATAFFGKLHDVALQRTGLQPLSGETATKMHRFYAISKQPTAEAFYPEIKLLSAAFASKLSHQTVKEKSPRGPAGPVGPRGPTVSEEGLDQGLDPIKRRHWWEELTPEQIEQILTVLLQTYDWRRLREELFAEIRDVDCWVEQAESERGMTK